MPTNGRLLLLPEEDLQPLDVKVADALRTLVAVGKTELQPSPGDR